MRGALDADLVAEVATRLVAAGVPSPRVDARLLVEAAAGGARRSVSPGGCVSAPSRRQTRARLEEMVAARVQRVPLQLVLGSTWFRDLELACRPGVFIPRPETEIVAGWAIAAARGAGSRPTVVDLGTGTGAIALSVAAEVDGAQVWAIDASERAVALAEHNWRRLVAGAAGVASPASGAACRVRQGEWMAALPRSLAGAIDVLVSNPPYLPTSDASALPPEVAEHDPPGALFGGADGHEQVDRVFGLAARWLGPGGTVVVEIDERRAPEAVRAASAAGLGGVRLEADLTGAPRAVVAHRGGEAAAGQEPK